MLVVVPSRVESGRGKAMQTGLESRHGYKTRQDNARQDDDDGLWSNKKKQHELVDEINKKKMAPSSRRRQWYKPERKGMVAFYRDLSLRRYSGDGEEELCKMAVMDRIQKFR
ncbi:hypothetical protein RRF57_007816 [Xylaria bambusicola]|uniref:Uncharacterized protein n=1 Tax=Xylaria bambusicola TaxID=326684 RepID=A0AAN7Z6K9_9PEZI